jgi:hypothetical protein
MSTLSPEMFAEISYRRDRLLAEAEAERLARPFRRPGAGHRLAGWLRQRRVLAQSARGALRTS